MLFIWVALYGAVNIISDVVSGTTEGISWIGSWFLLGYSGLFVAWILLTGKKNSAGLIPPGRIHISDLIWLLPLTVFPVYNSLTAEFQSHGMSFLLYMFCVSFIEEIVFRGFLLSWLRQRGIMSAIIITSVVFAVMHGINFVENKDAMYVWLQILSSFVVSICYCAASVHFRSIFPCVAAHFLTNVIGTGSVEGRNSEIWLGICILLCAICGAVQIWLLSVELYRNAEKAVCER